MFFIMRSASDMPPGRLGAAAKSPWAPASGATPDIAARRRYASSPLMSSDALADAASLCRLLSSASCGRSDR